MTPDQHTIYRTWCYKTHKTPAPIYLPTVPVISDHSGAGGCEPAREEVIVEETGYEEDNDEFAHANNDDPNHPAGSGR